MNNQITVKEIVWENQPTGELLAFAKFDPCCIDGKVISKVLIGSLEYFKSLNFGIRDGIVIKDDKIIRVVPRLIWGYMGHPERCALCGCYLAENDGLWCLNPICKCKLAGLIKQWMIAVKIKNVRTETIQDLVDKNIVKDIADIYRITKEQANLVVWGNDNLVEKINERKEVYLYQFMLGLSFDGIIERRWKEICEVFTSIEKIKETNFENIDIFPSMETRAKKIISKRIFEMLPSINRLLEVVKIKPNEEK